MLRSEEFGGQVLLKVIGGFGDVVHCFVSGTSSFKF